MGKSAVIIIALSLSPIRICFMYFEMCVCVCVCVCVCTHSYFMPILSTSASMQFLVTCLLMSFILNILSSNELNITSLMVIILE